MRRQILSFFVVLQSILLATAGTQTTVYYCISDAQLGSNKVVLNVNFKGNGDDWHQWDMQKTDKTYQSAPIYTYTFTDDYNGLGNLQFQIYSGSDWKSQEEMFNSWTTPNVYNGKMAVYGQRKWIEYSYDGADPVDSVTIYMLNVNSWSPLYAYVWNSSTETQYMSWPGENMIYTGTNINGLGLYKYTFPKKYDKVIFGCGSDDCKTGDETVDETKPYYAGGTWYATKADIPASISPVYSSAVPSQCPDVLLQGFYYDSYEVDTSHWGTELYGDTKWKTLLSQAGEIGAYFDLIWLPPSGYASGVGYHPKQYSNQNSDWGSRAELEKLIETLHNSGTKVIADIVINHAEAMTGWCDMAVENFDQYGKFEPGPTFITSNDEVNWPEKNVDTLAGDCWGYSKSSRADDGANWEHARDWAHDNPEVQEMFKAYLQWMKNVMKFDGWRYDKGDGFNNWHMDNYNKASNPYIAFMEYYDGNAENVKNGIRAANMNLMALDFPAKFDAINPIAGWNYVGRKGLIGLDGTGSDYWKRHAVTWVENHDMFMRKDNEYEFGGRGNSMTEGLKYRVLDANAFILAMPGVPCIFYPHWYKYKEYIKPMINARHLAGVHSESKVTDESYDNDGSRNTGYQATIEGKNGWLILCLGTKANKQGFGENYKLIASGYNISTYGPVESYEMWVHALNDVAPGIIVTPSTTFEDATMGIDVSIETTGGSRTATIYYTTDGTEPSTSSNVYSGKLNFKETTTLKVMAVCGSVQSKVQTYTYTYREPLARGIIVRFNKPAEWEKVYYFAWLPGVDGEGNATSENLMGAYPGQRIYQDAEGWYSYEFDASLDSVNFCINSGDDCGGVNVRSNDLVVKYHACYKWRDGKELENKEEEEIPDCNMVLNPEFDIAISPESGNFRSTTEGQEVTITAIGGSGTSMIYYTTDGSEPSTESNSGLSPVTFTVKQTSIVKAYAQQGKQTTPVRTAVYTYKAPQSGALTVKFIKPEKWEKLYLYAFTRVKVGSKFKDTPYSLNGGSAKWPGMEWTIKDGQWNTFTMPDNIKDIYVIFTEGVKKTQTQDIYLDENTCYVWNPNCNKAVVDDDCDGVVDVAIDDIETEMPILDITQPMYNILGQQVNADYNGIVIQHGYKFLIIQ